MMLSAFIQIKWGVCSIDMFSSCLHHPQHSHASRILAAWDANWSSGFQSRSINKHANLAICKTSCQHASNTRFCALLRLVNDESRLKLCVGNTMKILRLLITFEQIKKQVQAKLATQPTWYVISNTRHAVAQYAWTTIETVFVTRWISSLWFSAATYSSIWC